MKNNECLIYIRTKRGYTQIYRREKSGWTQTSQNGKVRFLSAEQLLSHMLPSLAGVGPLNVKVKLIKGSKRINNTF